MDSLPETQKGGRFSFVGKRARLPGEKPIADTVINMTFVFPLIASGSSLTVGEEKLSWFVVVIMTVLQLWLSTCWFKPGFALSLDVHRIIKL